MARSVVILVVVVFCAMLIFIPFLELVFIPFWLLAWAWSIFDGYCATAVEPGPCHPELIPAPEHHMTDTPMLPQPWQSHPEEAT